MYSCLEILLWNLQARILQARTPFGNGGLGVTLDDTDDTEVPMKFLQEWCFTLLVLTVIGLLLGGLFYMLENAKQASADRRANAATAYAVREWKPVYRTGPKQLPPVPNPADVVVRASYEVIKTARGWGWSNFLGLFINWLL